MEKMSWTVHPLKGAHLKTIFVLFVISAFCAAVYVYSRGLFWVILSAVILLASVKDHFLPVKYTLDENGVEKSVLGFARRRSWTQVKRVIKLKDGVMLSQYRKPHRFEAITGFYLRYGDENPKQILDFIKEKTSID